MTAHTGRSGWLLIAMCSAVSCQLRRPSACMGRWALSLLVKHPRPRDPNPEPCEQVQFLVRGAQGQGQVSCDMWQDASRNWQTSFLIVDVEGQAAYGRQSAQRVVVVEPQVAVS